MVEKWAKDTDKKEFMHTLEQIKDEQHLCLINYGVTGKFNAAITKLMLCNFGYSDKQETKHELPTEIGINMPPKLTVKEWAGVVEENNEDLRVKQKAFDKSN